MAFAATSGCGANSCRISSIGFRLRRSLAVHRAAIGLEVLNLWLAGPNAGMKAAGLIANRQAVAGRQMLDPAAPACAVHDQHVARLIDLFDLLGTTYRLAHG